MKRLLRAFRLVKFSSIALLAAALLVLLPALALLQYRWLGELAIREEEHLRSVMRSAALQFSWRVNEQFVGVQQVFSMRHEGLREGFASNGLLTHEIAHEIAQNHAEWRATGDTLLLRSIYFVQQSDTMSVERFNPATERLERQTAEAIQKDTLLQEAIASIAAPQPMFAMSRLSDNLAAIVIPVQGASKGQERELERGRENNGENNNNGFARTLPSLSTPPRLPAQSAQPAQSLQRTPSVFGTPPTSPMRLGSPTFLPLRASVEASSYVVLTLNHEHLRSVVLPQLLREHFSFGGESFDSASFGGERSCDVAIVKNDSPSVAFFRYPETLPQSASSAKPDITMPVALIPPFSGRISRMLAQLSKRSSAEHSSAGSSSVEPSAAQLRPKSPPLLLSRLPMFMEHTDSANVLLPAGMPLLAKWQARFYYKDGSLARDLRAIRVRNLVVSFGILLVLGAGIVLVLVASARSERLSRQQMQFVAGVSHEFRTPLAVLRSASDNLADGIVRTPAQTARYGAMMRREINRLWEMVEQTLTFAGIQSGRRSFELQLTQPEDIIERAVQTCGVMLKEAGVTLEQCLNSPLPAILAEPSEMASALTNLISNAVKYSADSSDSPNAHRTPRVRIEARVQATTKIAAKTSVKSIAANSVSMLVFTVQDNGIGISQDDQKHVFEPFYRAKHVVDEQIHGNGLGLAIVKDIVERHGGAIALQSALGKGTTFTIALPLAPAEAALAE